jgi:hypothetical protein
MHVRYYQTSLQVLFYDGGSGTKTTPVEERQKGGRNHIATLSAFRKRKALGYTTKNKLDFDSADPKSKRILSQRLRSVKNKSLIWGRANTTCQIQLSTFCWAILARPTQDSL